MRQLMCCCFASDTERHFMFLRAHLSPTDAIQHSAVLGLPILSSGGFSCARVPDDLLDRLYEYADQPLTEPKARELVGGSDDWERLWSP